MKFFSETHRKNISQALKGRKRIGFIPWNKGKKFPEQGRNHPFWKGGKETEKQRAAFTERKRNLKKRGNGGSHTLGDWENLKAQYNWTCPCCAKPESEITLTEDHIVPISKGGSDNIENIQPLCRSCNSKKHAKTIKYDVKDHQT
jgi:5-methylcytosine-specific restriction endonuclease McrA